MCVFHRVRLVLLAAAFGLAMGSLGCAGGQANTKTGPMGEKVVCEEAEPTGSHIPREVCYKQRHVEDRRKSDQEKIQRIQHIDALRPNQQNN